MSFNMQLNFRGKKSSWRSWVRTCKKATVKRARRLGKKLLEDAPKKSTEGWAD